MQVIKNNYDKIERICETFFESELDGNDNFLYMPTRSGYRTRRSSHHGLPQEETAREKGHCAVNDKYYLG